MVNTPAENKDIVLIVEDTAANYEVIEAFLKDIDVACECAFDGMEAVTMCSAVDKEHYSLILMDINLPYMDGFETATRIRDLGIKAPIIAITATSKDDANIGGKGDVFDFVLFKPFNYLAFYAAISSYIKSAMAYTLKPKTSFEKKNEFPKTDTNVCDIHQAIANMDNNSRLFMKHFNNFKSNNVDLVPRLDAFIEDDRLKEAATLSHSIKGLSGMLGCNDLYRHITHLEELLKGRTSLDEEERSRVKALLLSIGQDIRLVCQIQF